MAADHRSDQEIMASLPTEHEFTHAVRSTYILRFEILARNLGNFIENSDSWRGRIESKIDAVIEEAEASKRLKKAMFRTAALVGGLISFIVALADNIWAMVTK